MTSVPFTMSVYGGFGECQGLLRPDRDGLLLEYQVQDNLFHVLRGRPKSIRISLADLESVELKGRFFGRTLVLQARSLMSLAQVPNSKQGRVELTIARPDVPAAERLVAGVYE